MDEVAVDRVLPQAQWQAAARAHRQRVHAWTQPQLRRQRRGQRHPVEDFLWTYYRHRPARLARWHPGPGVALLGDAARERLAWTSGGLPAYEVVQTPGGPGVALTALPAPAAARARAMRALLGATAARPPRLSCFGLHEWAMVYRSPPGEVRHAGWPLRLGAHGTDAVVDSLPVACSHFDAYRFFTAAARPRNALAPRADTRLAMEQPGCLHATMDLYKAAYGLDPFLPAELVADCFALAREVRHLDMAASPYDLSGLGLEPVRIETAAGRADYAAAQRAFAERGAVLRARLIEAYDAALATAAGSSSPRARARSRP